MDRPAARPTPPPAREWVSFDDPGEEGRRWQLDVTFLTSHWECIFGRGCPGILERPEPEAVRGCCSYGAHFADAADRDRVVRMARRLGPDEWQLRAVGRRRGVVATLGPRHWRTRVVDGGCIFLNRPGFPAGPGCALHVHAERTGRHFADTKPEVCWQLPIRRVDHEEEDGSVTSVVTEFGRSGWGEGGADLGWWCTEEPAAFGAAEPVYRTLEAELRRTCGDAVYDAFVAWVADRVGGAAPVRHPTEVRVELRPTRRDRRRVG